MKTVRYLRMLLNSVLAGGVAAFYLVVLFLQLNPSVTLRASNVVPLATALLLSYGLHFAVVFYGLIVVRQVFADESLSPGWISFRVLVWVCALASLIAASLMWLNLRGLRLSLDDEAARRMGLGAAALTVCAGLLVIIALVRYSVGRRGWRVGAAAFVVVLTVSLVAPLWLRGAGQPAAPNGRHPETAPSFEATTSVSRVVLIAIDGASLDYLSPAAADGRLPNFGRMMDGGAVMHLATLRPTQPGPVWTSVATGKLPLRHGVRSAALYAIGPDGPTLDMLPDFCFAHALVYFGFITEVPHSSASVRVRPLWSLLDVSAIGSAVVRWPLTYPARQVHGALVSDRLHLLPESALALEDPGATYPPELLAAIRARPEPPEQAAAALALTGGAGRPYAGAGALALDRMYATVFDLVRDTPGVRFAAMRYQGLDVVGHSYLRQAMPRAFGDVSDLERRQYGRVLDQYYHYIDGEIGRALDRLGPADLLLVVSAFGMEPLTLPKRLIERVLGNGDMSGTHERSPDGFLMAYGAGVRAGRLPRASVLDVAPTVLYYFGLPIGRDMDGFARADVFSPAFTADRPITYIPTYER